MNKSENQLNVRAATIRMSIQNSLALLAICIQIDANFLKHDFLKLTNYEISNNC